MSLTNKEIEGVLNMLMKSMVKAFNLSGALKPIVGVIKRDESSRHEGDFNFEVLLDGPEFFTNGERGKEALTEFCLSALRMDQISGVVICHEAWARRVSRSQPDWHLAAAGEIREEALVAGVHMRGGVVRIHTLAVDPVTRRVQFQPYACPEDSVEASGWSRFSEEAHADPGCPPTYH